MSHKFVSFLSSLHGALIVLLLLAIPVTILYPDQPIYWVRALIILPVYFLSAYAIKRISHLAVYLLITACAILFSFLFAVSFPEKIYLTAAAAIVFIVRIPARVRPHEDYLGEEIIPEKDIFDHPAPLILLLFIGVYILGIAMHEDALTMFSYRLTFCYLINLILYTNLSNVENYLEQNREIANMPGRQILSTNRIMLGLFLFISFIMMIVVPSSALSSLLSRIGNLLWRLLRFLLSHLGSESTPVEEIIAETQAAAEPQGSFELPEESGPNWLTELLNITAFIFGTAICIAAFIGLGYLIYRLFCNFYRPIQENNDKKEFIQEEETDLSARSVKEKKEPSILFSFEPNAAVRRFYKRKIKKGAAAQNKTDIPVAFTPSELENYAGIHDNSDLLHSLYEKARYSKDGCTKDDANQLKHM